MVSRHKIVKVLIWAIAIMAIVCLALMLICNQIVENNAKGKAFSEIDSIVPSQCGLLLGTTPQTRIGNRKNMFFKYRIDAAEELYKAGLVEYILISGDENSLDGINEPECMKDSLVARGVPAKVIYLDGKGYRTLDSVVRMRKKFGVRTFTIISQRFHNERALYLTEHLGLDVENLQAYNAKNPQSKWAILTYIREYLARVKMFWDIITDQQPEELGEEEPLGRRILEDAHNRSDFLREINMIDGHDEQDTIVGNFTGKGIDTLYVCYDPTKGDAEEWQYYAESNNKAIPRLNLWGCDFVQPKLVNEGDLDGNGTCEVGYLHTWINSQWRYYRILTLVKGEWRYLVKGDYLDTPESFRHSGMEVAEKGGKKGTILIHYAYEGLDNEGKEWIFEIRDTIVKPTYSKIDD